MKQKLNDKIVLFCFPYAGASSCMYGTWARLFPDTIKILPIEYRSRGVRSSELLYKDFDEAIEDIFQCVVQELQSLPPHTQYALFGHSMGCSIAFEVSRKLWAHDTQKPCHLFFSGRGSSHTMKKKKRPLYSLPNKEFQDALRELGGTADEVFDNQEIMEYFFPIIRNDFRITYYHSPQKSLQPFDCNISVFLGKDEDVDADETYGWKKHTAKNCSIHFIEGDHFFINSHVDDVAEIICRTLFGTR